MSISELFTLSFMSVKARRLVARIVLLIGTLGPGLALTIDPKVWGGSPLFHQLNSLPLPLWVFGILLIVASVLLLFKSQRDIGYVLAAIFYFVALISGGFAVAEGHGNSALIFALPVLLWVYLEAIVSAAREGQEDIDMIVEKKVKGG